MVSRTALQLFWSISSLKTVAEGTKAHHSTDACFSLERTLWAVFIDKFGTGMGLTRYLGPACCVLFCALQLEFPLSSPSPPS